MCDRYAKPGPTIPCAGAWVRWLFVAGCVVQGFDCVVPHIRLSGETLRVWLSSGGVERLVSFLDLVRFCFHLGLMGWGVYNLAMLVLPFVFTALSLSSTRRWVYVAGAIWGAWQLLFEVAGPRNPEIQPWPGFWWADHVAIVATLSGFWVKPRQAATGANRSTTGESEGEPVKLRE